MLYFIKFSFYSGKNVTLRPTERVLALGYDKWKSIPAEVFHLKTLLRYQLDQNLNI
jgi:hypothetical protein